MVSGHLTNRYICTMMRKLPISILFLLFTEIFCLGQIHVYGQTGKDAVLTIKKTDDFSVNGDGSAENWSETEWIEIPLLAAEDSSINWDARAKVLYSESGIYFLFLSEDQTLSATMEADFMKLWQEDVVEVFLWPDESIPTYFEYEISPLNYELPILVSNREGDLAHWMPFMYEGNRKTRHKTSVTGGKKESGASISRWTAEFFIPFELLRPLKNSPPESGTRWRGNLYRIDYDKGETLWAWQPNSGNFHEYKKFGTFLFE